MHLMKFEDVCDYQGFSIDLDRDCGTWTASLVRGREFMETKKVDFPAGKGPSPEAALADLRQNVEDTIWLY